MSLREIIARAEQSLVAGPHADRARLDAETLTLHLLEKAQPGRNRAWLRANLGAEAEPELVATLDLLVTRRTAGEPIQYITGETEFYGLPFSVRPGVLIPRPETEHLVEEVLRLATEFDCPRIADIGTGSGAIAVALAAKLPDAKVSAVDISPVALSIAAENAERNGVTERVSFLHGDLLASLSGERFQIIASNPPYVPAVDCDSLSVEVRDFEPHCALFAGEDGLEIYRRLIPDAQVNLESGGYLVMEIGFGQQAVIEELLRANHYERIDFLKDYQGIPRVAVGQKSAFTEA